MLRLSGASAKARAKAQHVREGVREAVSSPQAFLKAIETKKAATLRGQEDERSFWRNEDLDLSPPEDWTWTWRNYAMFWWSYGFSSGVWTIGSSLISIGLNYWQAIICVFISHLLGAIGMAMHSRSGAVYHFGFPVASRITWGMWGSFFPVFVRTLVGTVWIGLNNVESGYFVAIVLRCIFGDSYYKMHNPIPASSSITIQNFIGLIIYMVCTLPLLWVPVPKIRVLFTIKSFVVPPIVVGLFIFCMLQNKSGGGPVISNGVSLSGSRLAWAMLSGINSTMGKTASNVVNQPDLARYARRRNAPMWSQLLALPIGNTACAVLGIFATSAVKNAWNLKKAIWNPWDLCHAVLTRYWNAGSRVGIAIVAIGWAFSLTASNIGVNVIPWGADISIYFPRFINIRRGMYLSYAACLVFLPWKILASATTFLRFLGGYTIFLGPFVGIFLTDYLVVRKGNIYTEDLFSSSKTGRYWYTYGIHWRAIVAYIVAVVIPISGFVSLWGYTLASGAVKLYDLGWILTCIVSSVVYFILSFVGTMAEEERKMAFEELAGPEIDRKVLLEGIDVETGSIEKAFATPNKVD
ncbi:hypothetical protein BP6252_10837 [Coleophoma cylindrospora]|uniref:Uracil permease n=1 Tax=Coleophoma cylindrospora TaxID=1849047 RepID=A0A3D8QNB7_9HELO|nr:hypothetical protein BP6252_10837 [Coleophoma cylindrospora]